MFATDSWLPLFPLKTVLFPDGILPLKVFEARYIDMVRECMKNDAPFGVVLIKSGQEVGAAAEPEEVGCLARITGWDMQNLGVMTLRTQGGERFRILETRVLPDQRLEARVTSIAPDSPVPASDIHVTCAKTLKIVIDDIDAKGRAERGTEFVSPFSQPIRLDSPSWVANRWCELLPLPLPLKQRLMELDNPLVRLELVSDVLAKTGIAT